jgi:integral membrane protein
MSGAFLRYRVMAYVTGVVLAAMTVWAIVGYFFLDYAGASSKPGLYIFGWTAHGWLYFVYLITGIDLAFRVRYSVVRTVAILVAGTVPFMSFVAEYFVHKDLKSRGEVG